MKRSFQKSRLWNSVVKDFRSDCFKNNGRTKVGTVSRTGRPRGFDRAEALDAALRLFWQQGYETTSISQLIDAMGGISTASFYATFHSKETLFREAVRRYVDIYGQVLAPLSDETLSPREAISAALHGSAEMQSALGHPTGCLIGLGASGWSDQNEELKDLIAAERAKNRVAIRRVVERAGKEGELAASKVQGLATLIDALLLGLSVQARDGVPLVDIHAAIDTVLCHWD
jgi:TetR/AcrR family transcriptional repressor for divergent bdcA